MKTINFKYLGLLAFVISLFSFGSLKAQMPNCPFTVVNYANCDATISYTWYDLNCIPCPGGSGSGIVLSPGQAYSIPCPPCWPACSIDVSIDDLGGTSMTGVIINYPYNPLVFFPAPATCPGASYFKASNSGADIY